MKTKDLQQKCNISQDVKARTVERWKGSNKAASDLVALTHDDFELFVELGHVVAVQGHGVHEAAGLAHDVYDDVAAAKEELEQAERDQFKGCTLS